MNLPTLPDDVVMKLSLWDEMRRSIEKTAIAGEEFSSPKAGCDCHFCLASSMLAKCDEIAPRYAKEPK